MSRRCLFIPRTSMNSVLNCQLVSVVVEGGLYVDTNVSTSAKYASMCHEKVPAFKNI